MNKKFLSVVLSASMVLSPMCGRSCFAVVPSLANEYRATKTELEMTKSKMPAKAKMIEKAESVRSVEKAKAKTSSSESAEFHGVADAVPVGDTPYLAQKAEQTSEEKRVDCAANPGLCEKLINYYEKRTSNNENFPTCLRNLKECANKNIEKNMKLFLKSNERNQTMSGMANTTFSFPGDAYVNLYNCLGALEKCNAQNLELDAEMLRQGIPQEADEVPIDGKCEVVGVSGKDQSFWEKIKNKISIYFNPVTLLVIFFLLIYVECTVGEPLRELWGTVKELTRDTRLLRGYSNDIQSRVIRQTDIMNDIQSSVSGQTDIMNDIQSRVIRQTDIMNDIQSSVSGQTNIMNDIQSRVSGQTDIMNDIQSSAIVQTNIMNDIQSRVRRGNENSNSEIDLMFDL